MIEKRITIKHSFIQEHAFENVVKKIEGISDRPQCGDLYIIGSG